MTPARSEAPTLDTVKALRVLFVGNSYVDRNDLPGLVAALVAPLGLRLETARVTAGGASLRRHLNSGAVVREIDQTPFDVVVLQEQSTLPLKNPARYRENVVELVDAIATAVRGAGRPRMPAIVLYETWARAGEPDSQAGLSAAVAAVAAATGAVIAPAGQAWAAVLAGDEAAVLHEADGSHPTLAGSLVAAAALALTLVAQGDAGR